MYVLADSLLRKKRRFRAAAACIRALLILALLTTTFLPVNVLASGKSDSPTTFTIRIDNISSNSKLPSPFSPGVWAIHGADTSPLFEENAPDREVGLAAIAEDGNPTDLAAALIGASGVDASGVFNTPVGSDAPGPLLPGGAYEFQVKAEPGDYLSFASMLVQTNDVFVGPDSNGIALFDGGGNPIHGDITAMAPFWDVGSERNEAPGMGPNQAPRQVGPNTGAAEGGVSVFENSTRSLPLAGAIVDVSVTEEDGTYTIDIANISASSGAIDTPIAPLFFATHNEQWSLFVSGQPASPGLEMQAEDGSPAGLVSEHTGTTGTGMVGAAGSGPALTGDGFIFDVTPTSAYPYLTFSGMVVQTNDAFFAPHEAGIALLHSDGSPRSAADVETNIRRGLAIWDAGTEANEVPGVGVTQAPRQVAGNTGPADPMSGVRIYSDPTNDLAGSHAGGFIDIAIEPLSQPDKFLVTIKNTSDDTVYPGILTPVVWATHTGDIGFFEVGEPASAGLESLAEDGNGDVLLAELGDAPQVAFSGGVNLPSGTDTPGPLMPGAQYRFVIEATPEAPYFSFAQMIVPSNDTFAAFRGSGLRLFDEEGQRRSSADLAAEIAETPLAWDAGTEQNQAGAAGPDQAPRQAGPNTGASEGSGTVRLIDADMVWDYPTAEQVVRITIEPDMPAGGGDPMHPPTTFRVTLTNISGHSDLPGPFAPGVFAIHNASSPLFTAGQPDRGEGLAAIAEDGNPTDLAAALNGAPGVAASGEFNTPNGEDSPGPIFPGDSYEFEFTTTEDASRLSLATMLVQSNDIFAAPADMGIELFDEDGEPLSGDISELVTFWDVGSERNEAPGMGPNQAPRQAGPDTGFGEGGVTPFDNTTRSLPLAGGIVDVTVSEAGGSYTIDVINISGSGGAIDTPIAPIFFATHNGEWQLFSEGEAASAGLEMQAEDGSPAGLVAEHSGAEGTGMVGAAGSGPIGIGESFSFEVTPTEMYPHLTFSGMVVQTNDVFFAPSAAGIELLNDDGSLRLIEDIQADIDRMLAIWDAGTEANEVPGVGVNQAPRQPAANTGPADPVPGVRLYSDDTNDLAGSQAGGFANMTITHGQDPLSFLVTVMNTSNSTVYPGLLTPVAWVVHDSSVNLFGVGSDASPGLEALAEDGDPSLLLSEVAGAPGVGNSGVQAMPVGVTDAGPIFPGGEYQFTVTAEMEFPYLSTAQMIVPSNDTFLAFGPTGIRLLDEDGERRSEDELAADIAAELIAWDAGTERNQAGAAGPDQAPNQAGPNMGANEGDGLVAELDDLVWDYPAFHEVMQVLIEPITDTPMDHQVLYISSDHDGTIAGIDYAAADILSYDLESGQWAMVLDGSDLGINTNNLRAFDWMDDGSLLISYAYPMSIDGIGLVDDSDIVRFTPAMLGDTTNGTFELYFDGSDVGLSTQGEDIDAVNIVPGGDLLISTLGGYFINGLHGKDEDLLRFDPTSIGENTAGDWSLAFDGSDVDLTRSTEDVRGSWVDAENNDLYLTTRRNFSAEDEGGSELNGDSDDVFICSPNSLGEETSCDFSLFWDGDDHGMDDQSIGAFTLAGPVGLSDGIVVRASSVTGIVEEMVGEAMDVEAAADVLADDMDRAEEMDQGIMLPLVVR